MDTQAKIVGFKFVPNCQVVPHEQAEIQHLVKKGVLDPEIASYN